ncbi:amino acid synthesis family protein [Sneathiella limimaris]|uniref:amino acid synthesis family protein n=1 Tax=Sneathiella limimaris TaxID=1964213 RepID=UPI0019D12C23|nr:amino acid synthesis family protein [Sneathiella limimaris]
MSDLVKVRKIITEVEEVWHEGGPVLEAPILKGSISAVVENPYAGKYVEDITPFMDALKPLGLKLANRLIDALGGDATKICSYGKGAIVGEDGEMEHGATWHVAGGYAMREALGTAHAIVPSSKKVSHVGGRLDIPLTHKDASYVRSHFDALEVGIGDAPRRGEILFALVMATGGRVHARLGGLAAEDISEFNGLR